MDQKTHNTLFLIHYAIIAGIAVFGSVIYSSAQDLEISYDFDTLLPIIALGLAFLALISHNLFFKMKLNKINKSDTVQSKFKQYFIAHIIRLAILEVGALFNIAMVLMQDNLAHLIIAAVLLFVMLYHKPTKDKIAYALALTESEKSELFA